MGRLIRIRDAILRALHPLTCPSCRTGARIVVVGGTAHHLAPAPRMPWERIVRRVL